MTERVAIIDLGSNSVRLIIMHIYHNGAYNLVYQQKETVRLSEGMGNDLLLQPTAMDRTISILKLFSRRCEMFETTKILALATAAVRFAQNGNDFLQQVSNETGIVFTVIDGLEEARLGFLGTINTIDVDDALLFDLGGGSLELTLIQNREIAASTSIPLGAVTTTDRFDLKDKISESQLSDFKSFVFSELSKIEWLKDLNLPLVGVGGTARNIAKIDQRRKNYPFPKIHNYRLGSIAFDSLWKMLVKANLKQRQKTPGLSSERADIIVAGTTIVKCLLEKTGSNRLIISGCGLREGAFFEHFFSKNAANPVQPDILEHSTQNMLLFYKGDYGHAHHVAYLAESMFDGWDQLHKLGPREKTLLRVSALLHDIGITINYYDHARHSAYLIENARLFGLTHREQMLCAVIAGWHTGMFTKYVRNKIYGEFLDETDWDIARKLAVLLGLAENLDVTQSALIKKVKTYVANDNTARLVAISTGDSLIELHTVRNHLPWFKKAYKVDLEIEEVLL